MEHEERKIAKVYAIVTLYTIILLVGGVLLGFALGRQSVMMSERERTKASEPQEIPNVMVSDSVDDSDLPF